MAPPKISMIDSTDKMVVFIDDLRDNLRKRQKVRVNMRHVTEIKPDGIVVLISILNRFKTAMVQYMCNMPSDPKCRQILDESGFAELLFKNPWQRSSYRIAGSSGQIVCTHADRTVDAELTSEIISKASFTIWGRNRRSLGTQRAFIELMMNTNNHASPYQVGEKLWWLSVNHLKGENKVAFTFVDYGIGIFSSLKGKKKNSKFFGAYERLKQIIGVKATDAQVLEQILHGELHKTVTEKSYRGKGLPGIYQAMKRNFFSKMYIITNNVRADVENEVYQEINTNFAGTFIYWEINNTNISHDGIAKN